MKIISGSELNLLY